MNTNDIVVIKLGGSLLDLPGLAAKLRGWLDTLPTQKVLLVVGGGAMADVVRALDAVHHFGESQAHWLAVRAMSLNARAVAQILPVSRLITAMEDCEETWATECTAIIDPVPVLLGDWGKPGELPRSWAVTSDSIAVRIAELLAARELILLKSQTVPADFDWGALANQGVVDACFPSVVERLAKVSLLNFRALWEVDD
jgi:aspartokinase-like uncharacterized kinase